MAENPLDAPAAYGHRWDFQHRIQFICKVAPYSLAIVTYKLLRRQFQEHIYLVNYFLYLIN